MTCASREALETQILPAIHRFMVERGLELSEEKTRITHTSEGFDFLGQNVRKYGGKLLIKPAKKSFSSLLDKLKAIIKGNASATQQALIQQLNPVIRGWAMYHRHIVAKAAFSSIDSHIWRMLWQWARRRHPMKGARWIKARYFRTIGARSWEFATKKTTDGEIVGRSLFRAMTVAIQRHVKIRGKAHPFNPVWAAYLARRRASKHFVDMPGARLWCW